MCRSFFQHTPDRTDVKRTDEAEFQTHLEAEIPFKPELPTSMDIDTCVENFSGAILGALDASTPKSRPIGDQRPPDPGRYSGQNTPEKPATEKLAGHQGPRSESRGQPPSEVCDQTAQ